MSFLLKFLLLLDGVLCAALTFAAEPPTSTMAAPESRVSSVGGVTVKVTPANFATGEKTWDFAIVLDTHSADLTDDLVKSSLLLDGTGGQYAPLAWDGASPGGHHREGVLRFTPVFAQPQSIELQITRAGEGAPRSFRWQLR
jgi:hypothetical protein